jgi:hypothetical protein
LSVGFAKVFIDTFYTFTLLGYATHSKKILYCPTLVTLPTLRGIGAESLFGPAFAAQKACSKKPVGLLISEPMLPAQILKMGFVFTAKNNWLVYKFGFAFLGGLVYK